MFSQQMTNARDIKSYFHLNRDEFDADILIEVTAKNPEIRRRLMDSIYLDSRDGTFTFSALPEDPNTATYSRRILVKVFKKMN